MRNRKTLRLSFACCVLLTASAATARQGLWTHLGGDSAHSAIGNTTLNSLAGPSWVVQPHSDERFIPSASPLVAARRVYVHARHIVATEHVANRIICFRAFDGERLWETDTAGDSSSNWSSPAIDLAHGTIISASGDSLHAMRLVDGQMVWTSALASAAGPAALVNASPCVSSGVCSAGKPSNRVLIVDFNPWDFGTLYAVNTDPFDADGNPFQPGEVAWTASLYRTSGNTVAIEGDLAVVASASGEIRGFRVADGACVWSTSLNSFAGFGGVTIRNGSVYAASYNIEEDPIIGRLIKLDLGTGALIWQTVCERTDSIPVVSSDGRVFVSGGITGFGSSPRIQAFRDDGATVAQLWDSAIDGGHAFGGWTLQPAYSGGYLFAGKPPTGDAFGAFTNLYVINTSLPPAHPQFVASTAAGPGGSVAICGPCVISNGVGGLYAFCDGGSIPQSNAIELNGELSPVDITWGF